jgi:hypothetical protein
MVALCWDLPDPLIPLSATSRLPELCERAGRARRSATTSHVCAESGAVALIARCRR